MSNKEKDEYFMAEAIRLARQGMQSNAGGPFGALVVKDGIIIGKGHNQVASHKDPTAHAEVIAIRDACQFLNHFQLEGCTIYASCEPCPMCLGAIYWARPERIVYACTKEDAAEIGFDDHFIYQEIALPLPARKIPTFQLLRPQALLAFQEWVDKPDKPVY